MKNAERAPGLKVNVDVLAVIYETRKKCAAEFIENLRVVFDNFLPAGITGALPHGGSLREVILTESLTLYQRQATPHMNRPPACYLPAKDR
ncbi:hypothetical protein [Methylomonas albis]|uniref:Uncharacterized protein n=1 Tax=Methylomonas albis TaxID=1854563 RepID=A0ABR9D1Q8_9GAMM|nr:hypothetical protein [Methylomonas albis]MBD9355837.1 hypothetical protein [Methylomonas albis]